MTMTATTTAPDKYDRYSALNPADHAISMIESCHGNAQEALAMAHTNVDFAYREDDQNYWDRVAIAIQQIITTRSQPLHVLSECASSLGTGLGQPTQQPIAPNTTVAPAFCMPADAPQSVAEGTKEGKDENDSGLVTAAFMEHDTLLRVTLGDPAEFAFANKLLHSMGSCRRWVLPSDLA